MDMDISMDIYAKSVDMDMDGKFHIHGNPAYLRRSPFLSLPRPPCSAYHVFVVYLGKLVDSVHCIAGRSNANMSWIFLEIPPGISWKSTGNLFS